jgi:FkbM family methyltransferase
MCLEANRPAEPITIVDIGASNPASHPYRQLTSRLPTQIIGFEPNTEECDRLNASYDSVCEFLPYFIGDGGPATFHETNMVQTGSLFEPNTPLLEQFTNLAELTRPVAQHAVQTHRLDDTLGERADAVDLIKIDAQGAEAMVFANAPRSLAAASVIHTEVCFVELYCGQAMFADIDAILRTAGFQFHTFAGFGSRTYTPVVFNNDRNRGIRQFLWADVVYVRDTLSLECLSVDKLRRMAHVINSLYGSADLVARVLTEADRQAGTDFVSRMFAETARAHAPAPASA